MKSIARWFCISLTMLSAMSAQAPKAAQDSGNKTESAAQEKRPSSTYRLNFVLNELEDGKRINQREYTVIASTHGGPQASVRIGTRVPLTLEEKKTTYINVGVDINCRLTDDEGKIWAQGEVSISSLVADQGANERNSSGTPVLRNTDLHIGTAITSGKPVVIGSIDDVNSKRRTQVELTATKID